VPEDLTYRGPGGETLEGWFYPAADGNAPLIVNYYGGSIPIERDFSFVHQWLAANGYQVLVLNPRGAYGFGDAFADHHAGDWGPKAAADVLAGVEAFEKGRPKVPVGIYGGSYGGFLTQYLLTVTDRFDAAVSRKGISDIAGYWGQGEWGWTYGDMALGGAAPWTDPDLPAQHSPLYRAGKIQTPLLLLHGLADTNVPPGQSRQMLTALRTQGKEAELVLFPGEDHSFTTTRSAWEGHWEMLRDWFDRWLKKQPGAWEARWAEED
jgi:dipeptidyl aminopeptidase/acylaminoacyl peptidase